MIRQSGPAPGWPELRRPGRRVPRTWSRRRSDPVVFGQHSDTGSSTRSIGRSAGRPQIRDLGFIVAGRSKWHEVKRVARYQLSLPEPYIPLPAHRARGRGISPGVGDFAGPVCGTRSWSSLPAYRRGCEALRLARAAPRRQRLGTTMHAPTAICWPGRMATRFISPAIAAFPAPVPAMSDIPTAGRISPATGACDGPLARPWTATSP